MFSTNKHIKYVCWSKSMKPINKKMLVNVYTFK